MLRQIDSTADTSTTSDKFNVTAIADTSSPVVSRIEASSLALSTLRTWIRDEHRVQVSLEEKIASLESQSKETISIAEDSQMKLKHALQMVADRESELKIATDHLSETNTEKTRYSIRMRRSYLLHYIHLITTTRIYIFILYIYSYTVYSSV
jgi:low affinity Fe/Cu permease